MTPPAQPWNNVRALLSLVSAGSGLTGLSPTVEVRRISDGLYLQADQTSWGATPASVAMTEVSAANEPGVYSYALAAGALTQDAVGYVFALTETTTTTLLHEAVVVTESPWEADRTDYQDLGTFGGDLIFASLQTPGAVGDVTVTAEDGSSNPVDGVLVRVYDAAGTKLIVQGYTDGAGEVTFGLPAGTYQARLYKSGYDFSAMSPSTLVVVPNTEVSPQLDGVIPGSASANDQVVLYGRYFGVDAVEVVFGTEAPVAVDAVNDEGTVALVTVPATLTGMVIPVKLQKPDPNNLPSGVLESNVVSLILI